MAFQYYSNILRIPDIDTGNRKRRRTRVLIFLNALMPPYMPNYLLAWNSLKGGFPYLQYPDGHKTNCKAIEHNLGMSLVELLCQRPLESDYIFFRDHLNYTKDEVKRFSDILESIINNKDLVIYRPIDVKGEIDAGIEDGFLCDYVARMQFLLLAYRYIQEYRIITWFKEDKTENLRELFSESMTARFQWYRQAFGTKMFSTYVNKFGIEHFRKDQKIKTIETYSQSICNVNKFLHQTIYGKRFCETRRKYSLFINEMQDIILPYVQHVKDGYRA